MFATIIAGVVDGIFKSAFGWISRIMERRGLIEQGKAAQYTLDLKATVQGATNSAQIRNDVQTSSDAAIDADLERLRHQQPSGRP